MKTIVKIVRSASFFLSLMLVITGCNDIKELNLNVSAVENLIEPSNGLYVELKASSTAAVFFEWTEAKADDGQMVVYEVVFDHENGDFSKPVFRLPSENRGQRNYVNITHKQLNKIASFLGVEASAKGKFAWTVVASKGVNGKIAKEKRTMEVTRLAGFTDIPPTLYLTGEATEAGGGLSDAIKMKMLEEGEFVIFTKLTAGKTYHFTDVNVGTPRNIYTEGGLLKEGEGASTVTETGVYKIELDFNSGMALYSKINKVSWHHCNSNNKTLEIPYAGNGVWALNKHTMVIEDLGQANAQEYQNPRYRFLMEYEDGKENAWGPTNFNEDGAPAANNPPAAYFYAKEWTAADGITQFLPKWKRTQPNTVSWLGYTYNFSLILKSDAPYTHSLIETTPDDTKPPTIPAKLYVTGNASEGGSVLSQAIEMRVIAEGKFEVFTKLTTGQTYHFVDATTGLPKQYSIDNGVPKENGTSSVNETAIYKILMDFNAKTASLAKINSVRWYHCNSNSKTLEIPYSGRGEWALKKHAMTTDDFSGADNLNPRYRFIMEYGDGTETVWGPVNPDENGTPSAPTAPTTSADYFNAREYTQAERESLWNTDQLRQFNPKWKREQAATVSWIGFAYDISLKLQAGAPYVHALTETTPPAETIPTELYVTGNASEGGNVLAQAVKMRVVAEGKFEVFTKLTTGQSFHFVDAKTGTPKQYSIDNGEVKTNGTSTVTATGVYKIVLNFDDKTATISKINSVIWNHCNTNGRTLEIPYAGGGVWALNNHAMVVGDFGAGDQTNQNNPRYRFIMVYEGGVETVWGPVNHLEDGTPSAPNPSTTLPADYFNAREYTQAERENLWATAQLQFNPKWKRAQNNTVVWTTFTYDISLILTADTPYKHTLTEK